ncbi:ribonuclease R [Clostridium sp. D2Q-11]|uniref:Ribonuclease R n=1 Tax=Anaeromonas frigoriresistens TaxID=2683708 RepID=A0A942UY54_9FIRM|nr:ribonuclease R [Anaeromonas frigoriresistens]MBS4537762.1 ribonuclease R [Anaeromonas frigoriresistens]
MNTKEKLVEFMKEKAYKPMNKKELADIFDVEKGQLKDFFELLEEMEKEGYIVQTREENYGVPEKMNLVFGRLQGNAKGFGFLIPDNQEIKDVFISPNDMNGALHNDKVLVRLNRKGAENKKPEGEVIRVIERGNTKVVGTFEKSRNFGFVVPDDEKISMDIFIPKSQVNGAKHDDKVVVEITKWPEKRRSPEGFVVEVLGSVHDVGTDILSIVRKHNLSETFPEEVMEEAEAIPEEIPENEIERRLDLRDKTIFTIDGADAKDLDDGVSVEKLENGDYKLGVHIADVTHYVKQNSELDKEALRRGTSVYLVDRVIPMLPKKLSNGMCSLNPHVPRLTLSVFMTIDKNGEVKENKIYETVIESKARMTYKDVSDILENEDKELMEEYSHLMDDFRIMAELSKVLRQRREKRGSIDFDFDEAKIILDEDGKPIDIKKYDRRTSNRLIEEFMLVCNETVAEYMHSTETPFLYRIHEDPDEERMGEFKKFIYNFGYSLKGDEEVHPKELQKLLEKIKGTKEETVINTIMLRSLKKAEYSPNRKGHFGLAAKYYTHFTSPIRRYPDLMIHRIIKWFINNEIDNKKKSKLEKRLPKIAEQTSATERIADQAERETNELKMVEYMSERLGEVYEGVISGVTSFGIFVELDNTIEGLVHVSSLTDGYYIYDELNYSLVEERTKKTYRIGDSVKIKVANTNIAKKEIDFLLVKDEE